MFNSPSSKTKGSLLDPYYRRKFSSLLSHAGVQIVDNENQAIKPSDLILNNPNLFSRVLGQGTLGLGEAYMEGWWDSQRLDQFFTKVISADLAQHIRTWSDRQFFLIGHLLNRQKGKHLNKTGAQHYNIGNDLYSKMLDSQMIYSCGYWQDAGSLDEAQIHKLELLARKLKLTKGMRVLDIGCGWGGSAEYLAKNHGVDVVGITLSEEQHKIATSRVSNSSLEFRILDFRELNEKFDRIYSLGMFEHVGFKNYRSFFEIVDHCLEDDGLFLLHTIGHRVTNHKVDPWIDKYIFPNSILPSAEMITKFSSPFFHLEDWHNFGMDYYHTLMEWDKNCANAWSELANYDETFQRMWHYFLMAAAGAFQARKNHLWQIVFSKGLCNKPYQAVRSAIS